MQEQWSQLVIRALRLVAGALLAGGILLAVSTHAPEYEQKGTSRPSRDEKLKQELGATAKKLVEAIEKGDPAEFLAFCSRRGVNFGTDEPDMPLGEIRKQIQGRYGVYCLLFDTACLRKQPGWEREYSYRELISMAAEREIKVSKEIVREPGGLPGDVLICLKGGPVEKVPHMNPLVFQFLRERGKWKLGANPY